MGLLICLLLGLCTAWTSKSFKPRWQKLSYKIPLIVGVVAGFSGCTLTKWAGIDGVNNINVIAVILTIVFAAAATVGWITTHTVRQPGLQWDEE